MPKNLFEQFYRRFLWSRKSEREKIETGGILTGEDLFPLSKEELEKKFGTLGPRLYLQVRGESNDQLTLHRERKSIGTERTLIKDTTDHGILTGYLEEFAQELERMLKEKSCCKNRHA